MVAIVEMVLVDEIKPDPNQPRKVKSPDQIASLAQNFKQKGVGIINPIEVDDEGVIVTGEMRWLAAKEAGFAQVPVRRHIPETPELRYLRQVSENVHQASVGLMHMSTMDTARAFRRLCDMEVKGKLPPVDGDVSSDGRKILKSKAPLSGPTADQGHSRVARRLGLDEITIRRYLGYLNEQQTPMIIQKALEKEIIGPAVAREVKEVPTEHRQAFAERIVREAKKGKVDSRSVFEVARVLKRESSDAAEVIDTIVANDGHLTTIKKLQQVAPTLTQAVDAAVAPGQKLEKAVENAISAIREVGQADALPQGTQQAGYAAVLRLRDTCDQFLVASGSQCHLIPTK